MKKIKNKTNILDDIYLILAMDKVTILHNSDFYKDEYTNFIRFPLLFSKNPVSICDIVKKKN